MAESIARPNLTSTPAGPDRTLDLRQTSLSSNMIDSGWHRFSTASNEGASPLELSATTPTGSATVFPHKSSATLPARLPVHCLSSPDEAGHYPPTLPEEGPHSSPLSHRTTSFPSPTKWTAFEDSEEYAQTEDYDNVSNASSKADTDATGSTPPHANVQGEENLSDIETRNLLDEAEGMSLCEEDLYLEMSEDQKKYYLTCFELLQKQTQESVDRGGALRGADEKVTEFFRKSQLDTTTLSKIWTLSDVNGDGFLNLPEFSTAMHLIVLHKKGNVPVPDFLPDHLQPPMTPPRDEPSHEWNSSSARPSPSITFFSNAPSTDPNLERPVPLKRALGEKMPELENDEPSKNTIMSRSFHETTSSDGPPTVPLPLSPCGPRGPPPKPPPRPPRSHARSASLDLTKKGDVLSNINSCLQEPELQVFAKYESQEAETQTDPPERINPVGKDVPDVGIDRKRISGLMLDLDEEKQNNIIGDDSLKGRCERLKRLNNELEMERVRLQQIRMALEVQIGKYN